MGIRGGTKGFLIITFNRTGKVGIAVDIGKEKENGTLKDINLFHHRDSRK